MDSMTLSFEEKSFKQRMQDYTRLLKRPRPVSGDLSVDILFLSLVLSIQEIGLPSVLGHLRVDLVTPWLIFVFVFSSPLRSIVLLSVASFFIENRSAVPSGLYFSYFFLIFALIWNFRSIVSWRQKVSWLYVFAVALIAQDIFMFAAASLIAERWLVSGWDLYQSLVSFLLSWSVASILLLKMGWVDLSGEADLPWRDR